MRQPNEFRLSELYLACRQMGACDPLTIHIARLVARHHRPSVLAAVNHAAQQAETARPIPFRRHPIDLMFVSCLASLNVENSQRFSLYSEDALWTAGALTISRDSVNYAQTSTPAPWPVLEDEDIAKALVHLERRAASTADIRPAVGRCDAIDIVLPVMPPAGKKQPMHVQLQLLPPGKRPLDLQRFTVRGKSPKRITIEFAAETLVLVHHAGLQGHRFNLRCEHFELNGVMPPLLDGGPEPASDADGMHHCVDTAHFYPSFLFRRIFSGLDRTLITLPDTTTQHLHERLPWTRQITPSAHHSDHSSVRTP